MYVNNHEAVDHESLLEMIHSKAQSVEGRLIRLLDETQNIGDKLLGAHPRPSDTAAPKSEGVVHRLNDDVDRLLEVVDQIEQSFSRLRNI